MLQNTNDVFAVSGTTEKNLLKIVISDKTVEEVWSEDINRIDFTQDMRSRIFLLLTKDVKSSFLAIGEKLKGKTLHWVEFKNGDLLWKMSRGSTETLLDYIDADKTRADKRIITEWMKSGSCEVNEESIWKLGERTVLVVAEPGMEKSSTTTQVAWNTKLADPTSWVLGINWNDHTMKLHEINTATFNFDSLVEFLCSAAFLESKYTDINRNLLKQALQNSGNVTVLMDGFDEISPTHSDKVAVIFSELMKTKVPRVWVTSRPVEKKRLENKLSVLSFSMKGLSPQSQLEMLWYLWGYEEGKEEAKEGDEEEGEEEEKIKEKLYNFLCHINRSVHDNNFAGCPLYISMIATAYKKEIEMYLNSEVWQWPFIDLVNMYRVFVDKKLHIYLTEKRKAEGTNSCVLADDECLKETYLKNFEKCALVAILPPSILKSLHNKKIEGKIQPVLSRIQAGKDKTGIVMSVVDGKPQFVHRTFAEYFTASWFSRNFDKNRSVLEHVLFDSAYKVITDMFNMMLAKDCPLHCAVLQGNYETVNTLLEEECDHSTVDKGGRNFMHTVAVVRWMGWDWEIYNYNDIVPLHNKYVPSLHNKDSVLQWTPLQYAIKCESLRAIFVEGLRLKTITYLQERCKVPSFK